MKNFTEKEWEILEKYDDRFYTAVYCQYIRAIWESDLKLLLPIYERVTEGKCNVCINCSSGKLKFMTVFGKIYFEQKEKKNNKKKNVNKNGTDKGIKGLERTARTKNRPKKKDS